MTNPMAATVDDAAL